MGSMGTTTRIMTRVTVHCYRVAICPVLRIVEFVGEFEESEGEDGERLDRQNDREEIGRLLIMTWVTVHTV